MRRFVSSFFSSVRKSFGPRDVARVQPFLKNEVQTAVQGIREQQLDSGIRAFAVLGFFILMASLFRTFYVGWQNIMVLHILLFAVILAMACFNRYGSFLLRAAVIVGTTFLLGISGLVSWGLAGHGITALFGFCVVTTMLFGIRAGIVSSGISIIAVGLTGIAVIEKILIFEYDPVVFLNSPASWVLAVFAIGISTGLIVVTLGTMNQQLNDMAEKLHTQNKTLCVANARLNNKIEEHNRLENEKKNLEARLNQAEKMEIIGKLAGGVAHDLNNILTGIVSYPDFLLTQIPADSPLRKPLDTIRKSGDKASAIANDLLTLARRGVNVRSVVNLNFIVKEYLASPEFEKMKTYHPGVQIGLTLDQTLANTMGSPIHLMKTVMNLVSNAAEAMPMGGTISICTQNLCIQPSMTDYEEMEAGNYAVLMVSDTGTGIPQDEKEKIFEPFYTKKVMGRSGTGLGMAVVLGTVKDHKGYIHIKSQEGKGTTFSLFFPATQAQLPESVTSLTPHEYAGKGESILVVDDMKEQREIIADLLSQWGYLVSTVSSGEQAVEHLKDKSVDLLILDMMMEPGMDGLGTYKKIIETRPGQKAIIISGFSESDRVWEAQKIGAGAFIKKPFRFQDLIAMVRAEIES
jgi:signal transduction histidine kinase/CheY-like chemotaxis protein